MWQWLMGMDKSAGKEQRMVGFYPLGQGDSSKKFQVYTKSLWLFDGLGGVARLVKRAWHKIC